MLIDKIIAATQHSIATTTVMELMAHDGRDIHRSPVAIRIWGSHGLHVHSLLSVPLTVCGAVVWKMKTCTAPTGMARSFSCSCQWASKSLAHVSVQALAQMMTLVRPYRAKTASVPLLSLVRDNDLRA